MQQAGISRRTSLYLETIHRDHKYRLTTPHARQAALSPDRLGPHPQRLKNGGRDWISQGLYWASPHTILCRAVEPRHRWCPLDFSHSTQLHTTTSLFPTLPPTSKLQLTLSRLSSCLVHPRLVTRQLLGWACRIHAIPALLGTRVWHTNGQSSSLPPPAIASHAELPAAVPLHLVLRYVESTVAPTDYLPLTSTAFPLLYPLPHPHLHHPTPAGQGLNGRLAGCRQETDTMTDTMP